mmetsp:Transcript_11774/g.27607  ORF Transcript_11774/g.27607 Transcript_11774/m.27607 type:complete len:203 (+) Transcript_11774:845-1453(+)
MGHHDDRALRAGDDLQQLVLQTRAGEGVERTEGLVHQQHLGLHGQRAGDADALLHAAGDLVWALGAGVAHAHQLQRSDGARLLLRRALPAAEDGLDRQQHVVQAAQPRQQRVVLEHNRTLGAGRGDLAAVANQRAAGGLQQPGDEVEQRRLAAAGMADQRGELTALHVEIHALQRMEAAFARREHHLGILDLDEGFHGISPR